MKQVDFSIEPTNSIEDVEDPENLPSLMAALQKSGDVETVSTGQMYKARNLYVSRFWHLKKVAKALNVKPSVIERWAFAWGWDEERNKRLFHKFQKVQGGRSKKDRNIDERADSIFAGIERVAEDMLQEHMDAPDGKDGRELKMGAKELSILAKTVKDCYETRRLIYGKTAPVATQKQEVKIQVDGDLFNQVGQMLHNVIMPPQISTSQKRIQIEAEDAEYEEQVEE